MPHIPIGCRREEADRRIRLPDQRQPYLAQTEQIEVVAVFASLSARERQILALITEGLANTAIAERLSISEKTERNHTSNIFDKPGVWSRAQAIVFARDHGFR